MVITTFSRFQNTECFVAEMRLILLHCATADFRNVDEDNIKEWIESDGHNPGYQIFTVEESLQEINRETEVKDRRMTLNQKNLLAEGLHTDLLRA